MALPADLSAAIGVSAQRPSQDLPRLKVIQVEAGACIDLKCVYLQSVPLKHLVGVDTYEAAESWVPSAPVSAACASLKRTPLFAGVSSGTKYRRNSAASYLSTHFTLFSKQTGGVTGGLLASTVLLQYFVTPPSRPRVVPYIGPLDCCTYSSLFFDDVGLRPK